MASYKFTTATSNIDFDERCRASAMGVAARIAGAVALMAAAASARPVGEMRALLQTAGIESAVDSVLAQPVVPQMVSGQSRNGQGPGALDRHSSRCYALRCLRYSVRTRPQI